MLSVAVGEARLEVNDVLEGRTVDETVLKELLGKFPLRASHVIPRSEASLNVSEKDPLSTPYFVPTALVTVELALYSLYGPKVAPGVILNDDSDSTGSGDGIGEPAEERIFCVTDRLTGVVTLPRMAATTVRLPFLRQLCGVCTITLSETGYPTPLLL